MSQLTSQPPNQAASETEGSFATELPTDGLQPSENLTTAAPSGSSFTWTDPNGYQFRISVSFGTPAINDPATDYGCAGQDAPPGTLNIPFSITITNLIDRGSSLPLLDQGLAGLTPTSGPGASTAIFESDGTNCSGSLYSVAGREQNADAVPAHGQATIRGVILATKTPIPAGATMTFASSYDTSTTVASIPIPSGS